MWPKNLIKILRITDSLDLYEFPSEKANEGL